MSKTCMPAPVETESSHTKTDAANQIYTQGLTTVATQAKMPFETISENPNDPNSVKLIRSGPQKHNLHMKCTSWRPNLLSWTEPVFKTNENALKLIQTI